MGNRWLFEAFEKRVPGLQKWLQVWKINALGHESLSCVTVSNDDTINLIIRQDRRGFRDINFIWRSSSFIMNPKVSTICNENNDNNVDWPYSI